MNAIVKPSADQAGSESNAFVGFVSRIRPVPSGSTEKIVSVSFRASTYDHEKLLTVGESTGAVTVEASPTGARTIRVDVTTTKYQM